MGVEESSESVNLGLWGPGAYITIESFDLLTRPVAVVGKSQLSC